MPGTVVPGIFVPALCGEGEVRLEGFTGIVRFCVQMTLGRRSLRRNRGVNGLPGHPKGRITMNKKIVAAAGAAVLGAGIAVAPYIANAEARDAAAVVTVQESFDYSQLPLPTANYMPADGVWTTEDAPAVLHVAVTGCTGQDGVAVTDTAIIRSGAEGESVEWAVPLRADGSLEAYVANVAWSYGHLLVDCGTESYPIRIWERVGSGTTTDVTPIPEDPIDDPIEDPEDPGEDPIDDPIDDPEDPGQDEGDEPGDPGQDDPGKDEGDKPADPGKDKGDGTAPKDEAKRPDIPRSGV